MISYSKWASALYGVFLPVYAEAQPAVLSGQIFSTRIDVRSPAASPKIKLFVRGAADSFTMQWVGPSNESFLQAFGYPGVYFPANPELQGYDPSPTIGNEPANAAFSLYAEPGTWTLNELSACDGTNCSNYTSAALAKLFPSLTIHISNPGTPDIIPPTAVSAQIKAFIIKIGSTLRVDMKVTDNLSGVASAFFCAYASGVQEPICAESLGVFAPRKAVDFKLSEKIKQGTQPGQYTVTEVSVSDIAGNGQEITNQNQINSLFGGEPTFTVQ